MTSFMNASWPSATETVLVLLPSHLCHWQILQPVVSIDLFCAQISRFRTMLYYIVQKGITKPQNESMETTQTAQLFPLI